MKKWIYWIGLVVSWTLGALIPLLRLLPIRNAAVFFLGMFWLWNGISLLPALNHLPMPGCSRRVQRIYAALISGMAIVWIILSTTSLSLEAWPMVAFSFPFLIALIILRCYIRKK
ncbi:MAG: hypothetical protein ACOX6P_10695 [Candidatus Merdivicinus sp.]|jgi:hypothetical protein